MPAIVVITPAGHLADAVVDLVADVDVPGGIHDDLPRDVELRRGRLSAVAREPGRARAGDGRDVPADDLPDTVVERVGDVDRSLRVDGDAAGSVQLRGGGLPAVARVSSGTRPRDRRDDPAAHLPDSVVVRVGDVQVPWRVDGDAARVVELRRSRLSAVPE